MCVISNFTSIILVLVLTHGRGCFRIARCRQGKLPQPLRNVLSTLSCRIVHPAQGDWFKMIEMGVHDQALPSCTLLRGPASLLQRSFDAHSGLAVLCPIWCLDLASIAPVTARSILVFNFFVKFEFYALKLFCFISLVYLIGIHLGFLVSFDSIYLTRWNSGLYRTATTGCAWPCWSSAQHMCRQ